MLCIGLGVGVAAVIGTLRFICDWCVGLPPSCASEARRVAAPCGPFATLWVTHRRPQAAGGRGGEAAGRHHLPTPSVSPLSPSLPSRGSCRPLKPLIYLTLIPTVAASCYMQASSQACLQRLAAGGSCA